MKAFIIGLCICFCCSSIYGQDKNYFQKGELIISIRNPNLGLRDLADERVSTLGSTLDLGYFFKDNLLFGLGGQTYYTNLSGGSNDTYNWSLQLFARYYFAPKGKKQQFIFYAEPRIEGLRALAQSQALAGNFINTRDNLNLGIGLFGVWRPHKRLSVDIGFQFQTSLGRITDLGQESVLEFGINLPPYISFNLYL